MNSSFTTHVLSGDDFFQEHGTLCSFSLIFGLLIQFMLQFLALKEENHIG